MSIKINTDLVAQTGDRISMQNQQIKRNFADVDDAMRRLQNSWQGTAARRAMEAFQTLRQGYVENRFIAIDNVAAFLKKDVSPQYEQTENNVISAAEMFK